MFYFNSVEIPVVLFALLENKKICEKNDDSVDSVDSIDSVGIFNILFSNNFFRNPNFKASINNFITKIDQGDGKNNFSECKKKFLSNYYKFILDSVGGVTQNIIEDSDASNYSIQIFNSINLFFLILE